MIEKHKLCIKSTWKVLKQVMGKNNNNINFPQDFLINNKKTSDQSLIAEAFNLYFSTIGEQTSQSVPQTHKHYKDYLNHPSINSMYLDQVEPHDIVNIVRNLKPKTSSGHDEISMKLIKLSLHTIILLLTHIINRSLMTGRVPSELKMAKDIPFFKTSENYLVKNYRPVSLLPAISKIYE